MDTMEMKPNEYVSVIMTRRLKRILHLSIAMAGALIIMALAFSIGETTSQLHIVGSGVLLLSGCVIALNQLDRIGFDRATWLLLGSLIISQSIMLIFGDIRDQQIVLLLTPIVIVIASQVVQSEQLWSYALVCIAMIIIGPLFDRKPGMLVFQMVSVVLTLVAAFLHMRMMGTINSIIQWSLANYARENASNKEINDKRAMLAKNLQQNEEMANRLRQINEQLESTRARVEEARHFRGQFLANMSHELRTPLNAIIGFSETMLRFPIMYDDQELPQNYETDLGEVHESGKHLLLVVNNILDLAKIDAKKLEIEARRMELKPLINDLITFTKAAIANKPINVTYQGPDVLPDVVADQNRLMQIMQNLADNAAKYTDEGNITFVIDTLDDSMLEFSIVDTGCGISEELHDTLFEEFQQARRASRDPRDGSGLGLALARALIELMDGTIAVKSVPGKGSTFSITIPLYVEEVKSTETTAPSTQQAGAPALSDPKTEAPTLEAPALNIAEKQSQKAATQAAL